MEFQRAQKEDDAYLKKVEKMGDDYDGVSKESLELDRELKDRVRVKLKMKKRSTPEVIGLTEYAKKCGINPSFILPKSKQEISEKHKDNYSSRPFLTSDESNIEYEAFSVVLVWLRRN